MRVQLRAIDDIQPYAGNPRQNDQAVDAVAASLQQFGFRQPIVIDANGVITAGAGAKSRRRRRKAAP